MTGTKTSSFRFRNWQIYTDAQKFYVETSKIAETLPKEIRYEATNQLLRSSLSVVLNIAEGSGKSSDKELCRFLDIAMGSLYKTLACLDSLKLINLIREENHLKLESQAEELAKQIGGFRRSLKS